MALVRMSLTNYRCFAQGIDVELRPLTIVLGKNNSGKSALVRAPVLCNTGIHTDSPAPLDLDRLGQEGPQSFTDLIYGFRPHGSIAISLLFDSTPTPLLLNATVQHLDEYETQVLTSLQLRQGEAVAKFDWIPADPPENIRYSIEYDGRHYENIRVSFTGMLPSGDLQLEASNGLSLFLYRTSADIQQQFPVIRYFGPFRDRPGALYRLPARMPADLGASGEYAAAALASDSVRQQGQLLRQVNDLLQPELSGWKLNVVERAGMYAITLRFKDDDSLTVNLTDVGTGVAQVLPILVQRGIDILNPPSAPVLEIVEQPELHLHPAAHGGLADVYINAAKLPNTRFIIETHSETFLLRVRRRIAEGSLDPQMLAVYFLESTEGAATARPISVAEDGSLDYWPTGVFSEDYEEARALTKAQSVRGSADAT
jgi:AAA ATPase domain